jgi:radical SAM superfamily enzyme YgiQ (UPF0313 family)
VVRNPVAPLITNLDELPFPDYDLDTHLIAHDDELVPVRPKLLRGALHRYRLLSTRGCPFACSFCNNAVQMRIAKGKGKWVRLRSNENVIAELEQMRQRFPTIEAVNIVDDLFFVRDEAEMEEFAQAYAARLNLPMEFDAHPNTISRAKVRALSRLPIDLISMGIQSGSPDTLRNLYNRLTPLENIVEGIKVLSESGIKAEYHYLVDNPFEPEENIIETLRFAATHHRGPSILRLFPLQLYPGTPLHDRARAAGVIDGHHHSAYSGVYAGKKYLKRAAYLELWLRAVLALRGRGVPSALVHRMVDFAVHPWVRRVLDRRWFAPACYLGWRVNRVLWKNLLYKPIVRPLRYLRPRRPRRQAVQPAAETGHDHGTTPTAAPAPADTSAGRSAKPREPAKVEA